MLKRTTLVLGLVVFVGFGAVALAGSTQDGVARNGQRLSLNFHDTTLKVVLERLDHDAKITVKIPRALQKQALLDRKVNVDLQNMDMGPALQSLFNSVSLRNFAIVYQPGIQGRITVVLAEEGKGGGPPPASASADENPSTPEPAQETNVPQNDPMAGVRWTSRSGASDPNAPPPTTVPQLPQFADEAASGESGPQDMPEPESAVPPAMRNLPPEPGPAYSGGPEGSPLTPQMRANMTFPPAPKQ